MPKKQLALTTREVVADIHTVTLMKDTGEKDTSNFTVYKTGVVRDLEYDELLHDGYQEGICPTSADKAFARLEKLMLEEKDEDKALDKFQRLLSADFIYPGCVKARTVSKSEHEYSIEETYNARPMVEALFVENIERFEKLVGMLVHGRAEEIKEETKKELLRNDEIEKAERAQSEARKKGIQESKETQESRKKLGQKRDVGDIYREEAAKIAAEEKRMQAFQSAFINSLKDTSLFIPRADLKAEQFNPCKNDLFRWHKGMAKAVTTQINELDQYGDTLREGDSAAVRRGETLKVLADKLKRTLENWGADESKQEAYNPNWDADIVAQKAKSLHPRVAHDTDGVTDPKILLTTLQFKLEVIRTLHQEDAHLAQHRGWKRFAANMATILFSAGIANLLNWCITGQALFFNKTTSQEKVGKFGEQVVGKVDHEVKRGRKP